MVYRHTSGFPRGEQFGLTSQIRRSSSAIGAAIAEACGRISDADARRALHVALAEACETLNHAILARDLDFLTPEAFAEIESELEPTRRMLVRLIERIDRDQRRRKRPQ